MRRHALVIVLAPIALALALALPAGGALAQRQVVQEGGVRVTFGGHLLPRALPRERPAPVTVRLGGTVASVDGSRPPQLREISIAVNRAGRLFTAGLPRCPAAAIQQTSTSTALERCRAALVGHGRFGANVDFDVAPLFPVGGRVLVFNSRRRGRPSMLLHLFGTSPVRAAFVLPFKIERLSRGEFGTVFSARIPKLASDLGYVTEISLTIGRTYRHAGKRRSFLSASCAAPAGFPAAIFELAKATFTFPGEKRLVSRLQGNCRVRG